MASLACVYSVALAASPVDTTELNAQIFNKVKYGPSFFDARIIDTVRMHRNRIWNLLQKKNQQNLELSQLKNEIILRNLLNQTPVSEMPADRIPTNLGFVMEEYERTGNQKGQALVHNTYGVFYARKRDYPKASLYFNQALALKERLDDKVGLVQELETLSALARVNKDYAKMLNYSQQLVNIHSSLHNLAGTADAYLDVAESNLYLGNFKEAEHIAIKRALAIYSRTGNKPGRLRAFETIAQIYQKQQHYSQAKWFFVQANTLSQRLNDREALVNSLCRLAEVKNILGDHEMALDDYREAERIARSYNLNLKLVEIKGELGEVYSQMGDYLAAADMLAEYDKLRANYIKDVIL